MRISTLSLATYSRKPINVVNCLHLSHISPSFQVFLPHLSIMANNNKYWITTSIFHPFLTYYLLQHAYLTPFSILRHFLLPIDYCWVLLFQSLNLYSDIQNVQIEIAKDWQIERLVVKQIKIQLKYRN